jgi:carboxymethylenebutenolidase
MAERVTRRRVLGTLGVLGAAAATGVVTAGAPPPAAAQHGGSLRRRAMSSPQQVWCTYIDAWNRHDVDAILDEVTDDFIYDERPVTMDRPLQGRPAFRAYLERTFTAFPDLRIEVTSCDAGSALTVSESIMRGTHLGKLGGLPATRRRITTRVACVFEVRDGKIAHERLYWDRANTLRQLGRFAALMSAALQPPVSEAALVRRVSKTDHEQH